MRAYKRVRNVYGRGHVCCILYISGHSASARGQLPYYNDCVDLKTKKKNNPIRAARLPFWTQRTTGRRLLSRVAGKLLGAMCVRRRRRTATVDGCGMTIRSVAQKTVGGGIFRGPARCKVTAGAPAPAVLHGLFPGQRRRVDARPAPPIDTRRRSGFSPNAHPSTGAINFYAHATRKAAHRGPSFATTAVLYTSTLGNSKFSTRLGTTVEKKKGPFCQAIV